MPELGEVWEYHDSGGTTILLIVSVNHDNEYPYVCLALDSDNEHLDVGDVDQWILRRPYLRQRLT